MPPGRAGLKAPSLNLPFRCCPPRSLIYTRPSPPFGFRIVTSSLVCDLHHLLFLCRLLRSAATPFGLCPRSFSRLHRLGSACPLLSFPASLPAAPPGIAYGRSTLDYLLLGQQLLSCSPIRAWTVSRASTAHGLPRTPQLSSTTHLFAGPIACHDTLRPLIDRGAQLDCPLYTSPLRRTRSYSLVSIPRSIPSCRPFRTTRWVLPPPHPPPKHPLPPKDQPPAGRHAKAP